MTKSPLEDKNYINKSQSALDEKLIDEFEITISKQNNFTKTPKQINNNLLVARKNNMK
jgi:hypothetical protein